MKKKYFKYILFAVCVLCFTFPTIKLKAVEQTIVLSTTKNTSTPFSLIENSTTYIVWPYGTNNTNTTQKNNAKAQCNDICNNCILDATFKGESTSGKPATRYGAKCNLLDLKTDSVVTRVDKNAGGMPTVIYYDIEKAAGSDTTYQDKDGDTSQTYCKTENKMYCQYKFSDQYSAIIKMEGDNINIIFNDSNNSNSSIEVENNLVKENFAFQNSDIPYNCIQYLYFKHSRIVRQGVTIQKFSIFSTKQTSGEEGKLISNCSSYNKNFVSASKDCKYGEAILTSTKLSDSTFSYKLIIAPLNWNEAVNYSFKKGDDAYNYFSNASIDAEGCPSKICYKCTTFDGCKYSSDSADCYSKGSVLTAEDIEKKQNEANSSGDEKLKWGTISAVIGDSFMLTNNSNINCEEALGEAWKYLVGAFQLIRIAAVLLLILLTTLDFVKAVGANDEDALKKAGTTFAKRAVIVVAIVILPSLIDLVVTLISLSNGKCVITNL